MRGDLRSFLYVVVKLIWPRTAVNDENGGLDLTGKRTTALRSFQEFLAGRLLTHPKRDNSTPKMIFDTAPRFQPSHRTGISRLDCDRVMDMRSAPLRPITMPGRAVRIRKRSLLPWPLDFDRTYSRRLQLFAQLLLQLHVFHQQLVVLALAEPAGTPRLVHSQPKSVRMDLLERRLAACVNIIPQVVSIYRWQGKVEDDREWLLLVKTTAAAFKQVRRAIGVGTPLLRSAGVHMPDN